LHDISTFFNICLLLLQVVRPRVAVAVAVTVDVDIDVAAASSFLMLQYPTIVIPLPLSNPNFQHPSDIKQALLIISLLHSYPSTIISIVVQ
jgi:ubiquitin-protein ligase